MNNSFKIPVVEIVPDSFSEYENHWSTTLFLAGCNLKCPECYNYNQVMNTQNIKYITNDNVGEFFDKYISPNHTGLVFLGGEPTIAASVDDFTEFVWSLDELGRGLDIKWYTNGQNPRIIERLFENGLIDAISIDLKCVRNFKAVTGVDNPEYSNNILDVLDIFNTFKRSRYIDVELRTTKWDCVTDQLEEIEVYGQNLMNTYSSICRHIFQDKFSV